MLSSKNILAGILVILSIALGFTLGGINLYALISGAIRVNIILFFISIFLVYVDSLCLFLLGLAHENSMGKLYVISTAVFGLTFYAVSHSVIGTALSSLVFWWMQQYMYTSSTSRAALFVKFIPSEIFMPALRTSFVYLMIFFSLISFVQTRSRISENTLINETLITFISKPLVPLLNKQINSQVISKLGSQYDSLQYSQKKEAAAAVLREVGKSIANANTGTIYGIRHEDIPYENVYVYENGDVDIAPIVAAIHPQIQDRLLVLLARYHYIVPILVGILVVLLIQPVFIVFGFIETVSTVWLFWILIKANVLKRTLVDVKVEKVNL